MEIYLIRHGQTDWNKKFLIQGRTDNLLNAEGKKQAREMAHIFNEINPTKLITSPLVRAKQTLDILKTFHDWDLEETEDGRFIERDFGEFEGQDVKMYGEETDYSKYKLFEQDKQLQKRVSQGIENIINKCEEKDVVVLTCHSHTMKSFLTHYFPQKFDYKYKLRNCGIIKAEVEQKNIKELKVEIIH